MRAEYRRVDQRHSVDILDLQSRLREEFKELKKIKKNVAMKVPFTAAYYEDFRRDRGLRKESDCGDSALFSLVQDLHKELSAMRLELKELKNGKGPDDHDRRTYFEKKFVDDGRDRTRGLRGAKGKGKGKGKFYRVGADNNVKSAFHVATETFVPACTMPGCAGCHHTATDCPELSLNLCSANDENVKSAHLAELVTAEMQNAFDDQDDEAFAEICDAYGQAEVLKGPTAKTFPSSPPGNSLRAQYSGLSTLSAGSCVLEQPLALRSVVFEDCDDTTMAETVVTHTAKLPTTVGMHRVAHDDLRREIPFDGYECPVMDMTPTVYNFNTATMDSDETDDESATDTAEIAVAAEVVSVLPQPTDAAEIRAAVVPPPRQRISGGGRLNTLQIDRPCDGILPICFHGWLGGIRRRNGCCRAIGTAVVHRALPCHRDTTHTGVGGVPACSAPPTGEPHGMAAEMLPLLF
ncbi:hypothetical protein CYMTET_3023 [Cymbomonas tetramitiformis]|uniref:Uncharacterized protein n=1 Tax=Cymbomonas tetramitiformis TaxID=36881 RepID=A0AAE0H4B3_9CHLO|nr:hypothetical protein CYMTET_3023 [Cymbomonas tetramitiformis]